jgi:hypothetical protein
MKKTLLIATTLTPLFLMSMANAALTEAPIGSGGSGSLTISGSFVDTTPLWGWEIPAETIAAAQDWTIDKTEGTVYDSNTLFDFSSKGTLYILDGKTQKVVDGKKSIIPRIAVGGTAIPEGAPYGVQINALGKNGENGVLTFNVFKASAMAFKLPGNETANLAYLDTSLEIKQRIKAAMIAQTIVLGDITTAEGAVSSAAIESILSATAPESPVISWLASVTSVSVNHIRLKFPSASIPSSWTASLPITVTIS